MPVQLILLILLTFSLSIDIIQPEDIAHLMYTQEITGIPQIAVPDQNIYSDDGTLTTQRYTIVMKKIWQKILPGDLPKTQLYAYGAQIKSGMKYSFPGPVLVCYYGVHTEVLWRNQITGKHILPMDYSEPFNTSQLFINEVPVVPHAHGLASKASSDGQPGNFWTASGGKSEDYKTQGKCAKNQALYIYTNQQGPGLFWYHDHAYGITRLNVYAGLVGFYEVVSQTQTLAEQNIRDYFNNGQEIQKRYFAIADRSFKTNGELYYPQKAASKQFTAWIPEFFGNMITVNGKVWPQVILERKKYRLIFMNACNARYINLYFLNSNQKISFQLIRTQGGYYTNPVITTSFLLSPGARLQIILDLTQINGQVMMKNNAQAPYPDGNPQELIDKFTGSIMKIILKYNIQREDSTHLHKSFVNQIQKRKQESESEQFEERVNTQVKLYENAVYPAFAEGQKVWVTLSQYEDEDGQVNGMLINGVNMEVGSKCQGQTFKLGKVYDFYIINLTQDTHPIHFHLIDMQKIRSYSFDADRYQTDWQQLNGKPQKRGYPKFPEMLDPDLYKNGAQISAKPNEKVFRDIIDAMPDTVTVVRVSFTLNNGKPFSFDATGSRYVWHCHMLEHEDNQMMTYFCLQ